MGKYILKRVLQFIPVFIGVTMILFAMKAIVPGDPVKIITGGKQVTPETELQIRISNGLIETDENNKPIYDENGDTIPTPLWKQYLTYMNDLLHGDLGTSYTRNLKVADILADKYPNTVKLAIVAILIEAVVGIGAGMVSAIKRYSFWDVLVTLVTVRPRGNAAFWLGMLLQLFFGVFLKNATDGAFYLPISGAGGSNSEFELGPLHPARRDARRRLHGLHGAHHALAAARGAQPRLHPHGEGQGPLPQRHHLAPRAQERTHPRRHLHRHRLWRHARRRHPYGDGLQLAGRWL